MTKDTPPPPSSVRMPPALKAEILARAEAANRSFSQEVVFVIRQYYANVPADTPSDNYTRAAARFRGKR